MAGGHGHGTGSGAGGQLTSKDWTRVVCVAGIGTVLEWFDFYIYAQLTSTLKKVFFPTGNPTAQTLLWWAVYAVGFVVRPLGALIFGHIGDTLGRNTTLRIAIVFMAIPTVIIGILPTYEIGAYSAGIAAPVLLTIMRLLQGLAMGGEFGPAIIYISELAPVHVRGRLVACLQMTVNIGMILATLLVMLLENTVSAYNMQIWGWRIPFLLAFMTAILGFYLRQGLPEPKAFLRAARSEKEIEGKNAMADGNAPEGTDAAIHAAPSSKSLAKDDVATIDDENSVQEVAFEAPDEKGALSGLHGNHKSKYPILRVLRNNWAGLITHVLYMAWVSAGFYAAATWLPAQLRDTANLAPGKVALKPIISQGIVIISMLANACGLFLCGYMFDKGVRALVINSVITVLGVGVGFGTFTGVWDDASATGVNVTACWFLMPLFQAVVGVAMASVALPSTRIYAPLERTTGFSFGYNCGYGVIGGLTPFAVSALIGDVPASLKAFAPSFWMLALGAATFLGCFLMRLYAPRLNKPFVGRIE